MATGEGSAARTLAARLNALFAADDERSPSERQRLVELMVLLATAPPPPDPIGLYPDYELLRERFVAACDAPATDADTVEELFCELYCHLHGHEAPYTPTERQIVDETGGYWCHAGGLSPLLKAGDWLRNPSVSADFGAGNGLQGLLLQKLHPHARTVQIEISSRMVRCGQALQAWLGIPPERVEWRTADVCEVSPRGLDFIYLYRPVKPTGPGAAFYQRFAADLAAGTRPVVIFSIADCLRDFLGPAFEIFYTDGHLTCFRRAAR